MEPYGLFKAALQCKSLTATSLISVDHVLTNTFYSSVRVPASALRSTHSHSFS
jgi:hypothetical protein